MLIKLDSTGKITLEDARAFTSFKLLAVGRVPGSVRSADVAAIGRLDADGRHLWVDAQWLRSAGLPGAEWQEELSDMLAYAQRKGWCDTESRVRAHIEYGQAE